MKYIKSLLVFNIILFLSLFSNNLIYATDFNKAQTSKSGIVDMMEVLPEYLQVNSTAENRDFHIKRNERAIGSGTQYYFYFEGGTLTVSMTTNGILRIGSSTIGISGSNTGIGTTTPATALEVIGTVTATNFSDNGAGLTGISTGATQPSVTVVAYINGTTTVTWQNINTPQIASLTLTGATCTVNMTGGGTGSVHRMFVIQDGTGTRTVSWATATVFFSGGTKPVLSATSSAKDELEFVCLDGVGYYCTGFSPDIK